MSADSSTTPAETLNVTLKFPDVATFVARFANLVEARRILLPGVAGRPQGTVIRFHLKLKDGTALIGGLGRVESQVAAGSIPGCPPGMVLQYQPDEESRPLVERVLGGRPDGPSPSLPPAVDLPPLAATPPLADEATQVTSAPPAAETTPAAPPESSPPSPAPASDGPTTEAAGGAEAAPITSVEHPSAPAEEGGPSLASPPAGPTGGAPEAPAPAPRPSPLGRTPLPGRLPSGGLSPDLKPGAPRLPPLAVGGGLRPRVGLPPLGGARPLQGLLGKPLQPGPDASGARAELAARPAHEEGAPPPDHHEPPTEAHPQGAPPPEPTAGVAPPGEPVLGAPAAAAAASAEGAPAEAPALAGDASPEQHPAADAPAEEPGRGVAGSATGSAHAPAARPSAPGPARALLPGRISPTPLFGALAVPRAVPGVERSAPLRTGRGHEGEGEAPDETPAVPRSGGLLGARPLPGLGRKPGEPRPGGFPAGFDSRGRTRPGVGSITGAAIPAVPRPDAAPRPVEAPPSPAASDGAPAGSAEHGHGAKGVPPTDPPSGGGGDAATLLGSVPPAPLPPAVAAAPAPSPVPVPPAPHEEPRPTHPTIAGPVPAPLLSHPVTPELRLGTEGAAGRDDGRFRTPAGVAPIPMPPSKSPPVPTDEPSLFDDESPFTEGRRRSPPLGTSIPGAARAAAEDEGLPPLSSLPTQITPSRPPPPALATLAGPSPAASTLVLPGPIAPAARTPVVDDSADEGGPPPARVALVTVFVLGVAALLGVLLGTLIP